MEFINDETDVPIPKLHIVVKISKWKNYDVIENEIGVRFIRGYNDENDDSLLFDFVELYSPFVLYELMELYNKLSPDLHSCEQHIINNNLTEKDLKLIFNFCKKHGLPFWNIKTTANVFCNASNSVMSGFHENSDYTRENILRSVVPFSKVNCFPIASFISGLFFLHNDFLQIVAFHKWKDDINIQPLLSKRDLQDIVAYESLVSNLYTPNLNPFYTFWDEKLISLRINCDNLMHFCSYQICLLMQSGFKGSGYYKTCKKCGQMFLASNPRQKFWHNPCTP